MQVISILQKASLQGSAHGKETCENNLTAQKEEVARADIDAAFESACRLIVTKSLPGWIEEIWAEHLQSVQPASAQAKQSNERF
jgi:hypothetical protein